MKELNKERKSINGERLRKARMRLAALEHEYQILQKEIPLLESLCKLYEDDYYDIIEEVEADLSNQLVAGKLPTSLKKGRKNISYGPLVKQALLKCPSGLTLESMFKYIQSYLEPTAIKANLKRTLKREVEHKRLVERKGVYNLLKSDYEALEDIENEHS
jgi:hypothetical protein